jgi:uncharacterized phage infection (PIP) family protein YhgE
MGTGGFSAGAFKPQLYRRFLQLIAMQDTFLGMFDNYASEELRGFYAQTLKGRAVDEVERMRKIATDSVQTGSTDGVEGTYWFNTITEKINLLKTVEDRIAAAAQQASTNVETVATAAAELSGSVTEISRQVAHSTDSAGGGASQVLTSARSLASLSDSMRRQVQEFLEGVSKL